MLTFFNYYVALLKPKSKRSVEDNITIIAYPKKKHLRRYGVFLDRLDRALKKAHEQGFKVDIKVYQTENDVLNRLPSQNS